jgi:hypothetical protein
MEQWLMVPHRCPLRQDNQPVSIHYDVSSVNNSQSTAHRLHYIVESSSINSRMSCVIKPGLEKGRRRGEDGDVFNGAGV